LSKLSSIILFTVLTLSFLATLVIAKSEHDFIVEKKTDPNFIKLTISKKESFFKTINCSFHFLKNNPVNSDEIWFAIKYTKFRKFEKNIIDNQSAGVGCYNFKTGHIRFLTKQDGLVSNDISLIEFDPYNPNLIWLGGKGGFTIYNRNTNILSPFTDVSEKSINKVWKIEFDSYDTNNVWIAARGKIICFFRRTEKLKLVENTPQDIHERFLEVDEDSIWFASKTIMGHYSKKDNITTFYEANDYFGGITPNGMPFPQVKPHRRINLLKNKFILSMVLLDHRLLILTPDGLVFFSPRKEANLLPFKGLSKMVKIKNDSENLLLFSESGQVFTYNDNQEVIRKLPIRRKGTAYYNDKNFLYMDRLRLNKKNFKVDKEYDDILPFSDSQAINSILPVDNLVYFATSENLYRVNY